MNKDNKKNNKVEKENNQNNTPANNINKTEIKEQNKNNSKKEIDLGLKVLIVAVLAPIFTFIIFFLVGGLASILQEIFEISFFASFIERNTVTCMGIGTILGILFALAAVTDAPKEKENNETNQNKN